MRSRTFSVISVQERGALSLPPRMSAVRQPSFRTASTARSTQSASAAMLLRYSLSLAEEANCMEQAVDAVLRDGWRTADILGGSDSAPLSCTEMTEKVLECI